MKKPILHSLMAWVFPRITGWAGALGRAEYKSGYKQGYARAKRDVVRSMMANIDTWYSVSSSENDTYEWHQITLVVDPEDADA